MYSKLVTSGMLRAKRSPKIPSPRPAGPSPPASERARAERLRRDPLLLGAVAACALLLAFALAITLLRPSWLSVATDWLSAAVAWLELLVVVGVARWLGRLHRPEALAWWLACGGTACFAVARSWWAVEHTLLYPHSVPFPSLPDVLFVLAVPFYALAVIAIPFGAFPGPRLLAILDAVLWTAATTAIAWYVFIAQLFATSGLSPLGKAVSLFYTLAGLFLLLALFQILLHPLRFAEDWPVLGLLIAAAACHLVADAWATWLVLHGAPSYHTGRFPHLFWLASSLLLALAALVQVRAVQRAESGAPPTPARFPLDRADLRAALRLFLPLVAALLAGAVLLLRAYTLVDAGADWRLLLPPLLVGTGLLTLLVVRQAVQFLELVRLRREAEAARAEERAQRELNRRKDEFLGVVSHELRTPLTSLVTYLALVTRRLNTLVPPSAQGSDGVGALETALTYSKASARRLVRLADDLADDERVVQGRLRLRLQPCDLAAVVRAAVAEQCAAAPDRPIMLELPALPGGDRPVPVLADAERIAQVVTNYLANALKYSPEDRPVAVRLEVVGGEEEGAQARVSVRDEGIGIPLVEQPHIWERFHTAEGNAVQSGSGTSLGLGLHISRAIVEEHCGHVGLESTPGRGSTFWFTLPLAGAPPEAP